MSGNLTEIVSLFRIKAQKNAVKIARLSMLDLFSSVVMDTPVDKGFLRNGWLCTFERPSDDKPKHAAPTGGATIGRVKAQLSELDERVIDVYFVNNYVYAPRIEYEGHSGKAPQGMIRVNTIRWDSIVQNNVRKYAR